DHLEEKLPQADLFLSASETESFGLSMLEAMSCGVPCVSTAVGGVAEVLGETGMLTPFGEPEAMARAALQPLLDGNLHALMAKASRSRAVELFAMDAVVAKYVDLYERVLQ
ncbi:MAG TPA: glycosyltransferase, partial [Planctomycetota bacterium]|nr:glycosyltransferase [Planctomycetota bacterium]